MVFYPLSIPTLLLGHLFFAHVPSSKFMSLTPTSPSYKCPHFAQWGSFAHLPAPETTSANCVVGNLSLNGSSGTLCTFLSIWCHSLLCHSSCAMPFSYLLQCHSLFSVSKISSNSQTCCFSPCPSLRNNLFFLNRRLFNFSILTATETTSTYSFPKYSAPPQHRQLFPE